MAMNQPAISEKLNFRIGEVSEMVGLKPHVIRFWETEFSQIRPSKTSGGVRLYNRRNIEVIQQIKHLLYEKGFTIAGAKKALSTSAPEKSGMGKAELADNVLEELRAIRDILS